MEKLSTSRLFWEESSGRLPLLGNVPFRYFAVGANSEACGYPKAIFSTRDRDGNKFYV